jgi:hypothetical protein
MLCENTDCTAATQPASHSQQRGRQQTDTAFCAAAGTHYLFIIDKTNRTQEEEEEKLLEEEGTFGARAYPLITRSYHNVIKYYQLQCGELFLGENGISVP